MNQSIARKSGEKSLQASSCGQAGHDREQNVGESERWASMFAGGFLTACGLLRGSTSGLALAAIGGALAYRGYTGHCQVYEAIGHCSVEEPASLGHATNAPLAAATGGP